MFTIKNVWIKNLKYLLPALGLCLLVTAGTMAQETATPEEQQQEEEATPAEAAFKDEDLKKFTNAAGKVMVIQQETEQEMMAVLEEENLDVEKFNTILMAQQTQDTTQLDASEEEMQSFNKASQKMMEIQKGVEGKMVKAIQEEGLEPERYEQILMAYQSDPQVKAKVDALLQEQQ